MIVKFLVGKHLSGRGETTERKDLVQIPGNCFNVRVAQVGCMRQALGPGALGRPKGIGWRAVILN